MNSPDDPEIRSLPDSGPSIPEDAPAVSDKDALETWLKSAGFENSDSPFTARIVRTIGVYLTRIGLFPNSLACEIIADVDFTSSVTMVQLPASSFVRSTAFEGVWLTDTGLPPDSIRSTPFPRRRKILYCPAVVPALKATSKSVYEQWSRDQLFAGVPPVPFTPDGHSVSAGGTQYLVVNQQLLREL
jgi:hypothetical protein